MRHPLVAISVKTFRKSSGKVVQDYKRFKGKKCSPRSNAGRNQKWNREKGKKGFCSKKPLLDDDVDDATKMLINSLIIEDKIKLARGTRK